MSSALLGVVLFSLLCSLVASGPSSVLESRLLRIGEKCGCCDQCADRDLPTVYCYREHSKLTFWTSASVLVSLPPDQFSLYEGSDVKEVFEQFEARKSSQNSNILNIWNNYTILSIDPFNSICLGIRTERDYTIELKFVEHDIDRQVFCYISILLFCLSPTLARNPLLYYVLGICAGVALSVLILIYFILKMLPMKRSVLVGIFAGGSTLVFYFFKAFSDYILAVLMNNRQYVFGYLLLAAAISFGVCYRFGPVTDPRSQQLVQWIFQAIALTGIFYSSQHRAFTLAVDIILVAVSCIPSVRRICGTLFRDSPDQLVLRRTGEHDYQK